MFLFQVIVLYFHYAFIMLHYASIMLQYASIMLSLCFHYAFISFFRYEINKGFFFRRCHLFTYYFPNTRIPLSSRSRLASRMTYDTIRYDIIVPIHLHGLALHIHRFTGQLWYEFLFSDAESLSAHKIDNYVLR